MTLTQAIHLRDEHKAREREAQKSRLRTVDRVQATICPLLHDWCRTKCLDLNLPEPNFAEVRVKDLVGFRSEVVLKLNVAVSSAGESVLLRTWAVDNGIVRQEIEAPLDLDVVTPESLGAYLDALWEGFDDHILGATDGVTLWVAADLPDPNGSPLEE